MAFTLLTGAALPPVAPARVAYDVMTADVALLPNGRFQWNDTDPQSGPLGIWVSIPRQHIYVFRSGKLVGMSTVSTGKPGHTTPAGTFTILQKREWHRSNIYSNAPMPFMQRLTWTGIALHAGKLPGWPASHGCIRLPLAFAKLLFAATRVGDQVVISAIDNRRLPVEPLAPTVIASTAPQSEAQLPAAPAIAVAYNARSPRLMLDYAAVKAANWSDDDVSGGVHWGQVAPRRGGGR